MMGIVSLNPNAAAPVRPPVVSSDERVGNDNFNPKDHVEECHYETAIIDGQKVQVQVSSGASIGLNLIDIKE